MILVNIAFFTKDTINVNFRFHPNLCNNCLDLLQKAISLKRVAHIFVEGNTDRHFGGMTKN